MENSVVMYQILVMRSLILSVQGTRIGDIAYNDVAGVVASTNYANQRNIRTNENYNEGFVRRRKLYNYPVAANDDFRDLELFIPLNRIFSFVIKLIDYSNIFLLKLY